MHEKLIYIMDPMCSWCWGFAPVLGVVARQAANHGVSLELIVGGLRQEQAPMTAALRSHYQGYWRQVQARTGQNFNFAAGLPDGMCYTTEPACRAIVTVRQLRPELTWAMAHRIQAAFYTEGADTSADAVLTQLAVQLGVPEAEFAPTFASAEMQQETAHDKARAEALGVTGFPTLLLETTRGLVLLSAGYQSLERLQQICPAHWQLPAA